MWVTLDQIDCLLAISNTGSISAAAEQMHRAKSAVYYSIGRLEEQLGFKVIDSRGYRGVLTEQGRQFLLMSAKLLVERDNLKESIYRISQGIEAKISISASALFELKVFNQAILKIQKKFPQTEIVFHREILSGEKMLKRGITDIGLFEMESRSPEFESKLISSVELHLVVAKEHSFFELPQKEQNIESLIKYPQVIQRSTLPDDEEHGVYSGAKRWTVSDLTSKKQIIVDGLGWGRLPYHEIRTELSRGKLICLEQIEKPMSIPIFLVRRKQASHGQVSQALWEVFE